MLGRRSFITALLGSAAAFHHIDKLRAFIENHNEPLLSVPKRADEVLYLSRDFTMGEWRIYVDHPRNEPDFSGMTYRQFSDEFLCGMELDWLEEDELDTPVSEWWAFENWYPNHSPDALAFERLAYLDLGLQSPRDTETDGWIDFTDGPCPGNDSRFVEVDTLGASLLQQRLNELGEGIRLELI